MIEFRIEVDIPLRGRMPSTALVHNNLFRWSLWDLCRDTLAFPISFLVYMRNESAFGRNQE